MYLDKNGQPTNSLFNFSRNKEKAILGLKGLLSGVVADEKLNETELLFLDVWLKEQAPLKNDGDVIDLLDLIGDVLEDGVVTAKELKELYLLISDILNYKDIELSDSEGKLNEFVGLLSGIVADGVLNELEIMSLMEWLDKNQELRARWPVSVIFEKLQLSLKNNIIQPDEKEHLVEVIKQITGVRFEETGVAYGMATEFFEDDIVDIKHENSVFCFTGTFVTGKRSVVQDTAREKGGIIKDKVTSNLNYLIIGTLASKDWRFTSHGRKIEKAISLKNKGYPVAIISERTWAKYLFKK
jgi:NAD-dependent DNA ligase